MTDKRNEIQKGQSDDGTEYSHIPLWAGRGGSGGGDRTNLISWQSWIANVEGMVGDAPEEWEEAGKNSESLTGLAATLGKWEVKAEPIIWLR